MTGVMKICPSCNEEKDLDDFGDYHRSKNGKQVYCKICRRAKYSSEVYRNWDLKHKYGMTLKEYDILLEKQNFVCAICKKPETAFSSQ